MNPIFDHRWRILVTGITSIHGWPVYEKLKSLLPPQCLFGIRPPKMAVPDGENTQALCITDKEGLLKIRDEFQPTHVVHCSGVCDLDVCEERPNWAEAINRMGSKRIAELFGPQCYLLYLSTDLVFSGNNPPAGGYCEEHLPDPLSIAGKTFSLAEEEIRQAERWCILRLGLPIGDSVTGKKGAVDWIESRFKRSLPVSLFYDEWRSCLNCEEIAEIVSLFLCHEEEGLYHFGGEKPLSLYEVGCLVLEKGNYTPSLLKGVYRNEEVNGPPRIGDVSLNSSKLRLRVEQLINNFSTLP